jgi:phenylacetate-CoA ligase
MALASRSLVLPLFIVARGGIKTLPFQLQLSRSQYFTEEQIRRLQWRRLRRLLRYVYEHNRFYRARFDGEGITPDDIRSFDDFSHLPLLTKDDIRNNLEALISDGFDKSSLVHRRTGGSTGVPLQLYWDKDGRACKEAVIRRHDRWASFLPGERGAALWGDIRPPTTLLRKLKSALLLRTIYLDTLQMDEQSMLEFVEQIRRTGTRLLFGHGHSIYYFVQFLREQHITDLKFDGIISSAEMLPPEERQVVEEVFGGVVFDRYGCEEVGLIASECEVHDGLHTAAEVVYVEVPGVSEDENAEVIVTDLVNRATPLLRYAIGDLSTAKSGPCPCGRGLPRLGRIIGRTTDILYSPEGKRISGVSILDTAIIHIPGFRQVQVVQEKLDELTFNIVKDSNFSKSSLTALDEAVLKYFGPRMKHKVLFVEKIPLTERGKFQFSVCRLKASELQPIRRNANASVPASIDTGTRLEQGLTP